MDKIINPMTIEGENQHNKLNLDATRAFVIEQMHFSPQSH
jgi:hypothetical protein